MLGAKAWAAYTAAIVGAQVENFEQKFSGLAESERNAWAAAQDQCSPVKAQEPAKIVQPAPLKL